MWDIALLMTAAFVAGALNAVAGGGSFLTLPALVFTGVPPVAANATGTVALLPGYMAGAWGFRQDMEPPPGLGILLLALFGLLGQTRLHAMNGMKNLVSALLTAIAVAIYAAGGVVQWEQALTMMIAATAGGYGGARLARRIPPEWLRAGIVLTGLVMAGVFFWRQ
jgi:uncharacterized membrane protein YfcA